MYNPACIQHSAQLSSFTKHSSRKWVIIQVVDCYFYAYGMRKMKAPLKAPRMVKRTDHQKVRIHAGAFWSVFNTPRLTLSCFLCVWSKIVEGPHGDLSLLVFCVSGWVYHLYRFLVGCPDQSTLESMTPQERKRQDYIHELIDTEEKYIKDLQLVLEVDKHWSSISHLRIKRSVLSSGGWENLCSLL